jgi:uncharacterized protein
MNINTASKNRVKEIKALFVKKIKTHEHYYIYDVCSNEIIKVNRKIWDMIDCFHRPVEQIINGLKGKYKKNDILNTYKSLQKANASGVFSSHRPIIRSNRKDKREILYFFENSGIQQIIIDLTNRCNMRCKYCIFSGKYINLRTHKNKEISQKNAIKAVDYFIRNCSKKERPFVTFYGGEPFLKFNLFKYIVDYVKSYDKNFHFSLTTNGTLLNDDEICSYLIENDISINVSLDGPKHIHDKNRVMFNGDGSFDQIMENLRRIKELSPAYFYSKIFYSPVITPPYDFDEIKSFFYESKFFDNNENPLNIVTVSTYATTLFKDIDMALVNKQFKKNRGKMLECYKNALILGQYDELSLEKHWFNDLINCIHFREKTRLKKYFTVIGQCIPGVRRLFVNTDGKYYMCEKVGEFFCIGDIHKGLDFDRIYNFFELCDEFFKDCSNCWALRLCKRCFVDVNCEDSFDMNRKEKFCKSKIKYLETIISAYCEILEENPDAFKKFNPEDFYKD